MATTLPRTEPRKEQVCTVCLQLCTHTRLFCDMCSSWVHTNCDGLTPDKVKGFERLPPDWPYICRKCRCDEEGNFDFEKASERLHRAAIQGFKKLQACVKRELLFLDGGFVGVSGIGNLAVDQYSQTLLESYAKDQNGIPACTTADGQALFCAASLAVSARESLATELRVRCCLEMVTNESFYRWQKNHAQLTLCAPDYADSCLDCAIPGEPASVWMMSALPSVVNRPVTSVYPNLGHPSNPTPRVLNTTFYPRTEGMLSQPVKIMWTNRELINANQKWTPNHFVPLFEQQQSDSAPPSPAAPTKQEVDQDLGQVDDSFDDPDLHAAVAEATREAMAPAEGGFPMDIPRYMDVYEAYDHITNATEVLAGIPKGRKDNCWFLIDNSYNVNNPNRKNVFFDDCGVWDSKLGSVVKSYYVFGEKNELQSLRVKDGVYQVLKTVGPDKRLWENCDPAPDPDKMVICHRYYAFLKRDNTYKRRILWFTFPPGFEKGRDVAIAEYCGLYPGHGDAHGNSRGRRAYRRTDPKLLDQIAEHLQQSSDVTPNKLYKDLVQSLGPDNTLRDARQIRNLKYKLNKKAGKVKPRPRSKGQAVHATQTPIVEKTPPQQTPIQVVIQGVQGMEEVGQVVLDDGDGQKIVQVSGQTAIQLVGPDGTTTALQRDVDTQTIIIEGLPMVSEATYMEQAQ